MAQPLLYAANHPGSTTDCNLRTPSERVLVVIKSRPRGDVD
jgi:hypothetical protein